MPKKAKQVDANTKTADGLVIESESKIEPLQEEQSKSSKKEETKAELTQLPVTRKKQTKPRGAAARKELGIPNNGSKEKLIATGGQWAYSEEEVKNFQDRIILLIIEENMSLRQILMLDDMPSTQTVYKWIDKDEAFAKRYAKAKRIQVESMADEILMISDTKDVVVGEGEDGNVVARFDNAHVQHRKLQVDTRKWLMAKLMPEKYGDKVEVESTVNIGQATIDRLAELGSNVSKVESGFSSKVSHRHEKFGVPEVDKDDDLD